MKKRTVLEITVKALNNTAGPNGLVPTLLVFGIIPRLPVRPVMLPVQLQCIIAMDEGRMELVRKIAQDQVRKALKNNGPNAAMTDL